MEDEKETLTSEVRSNLGLYLKVVNERHEEAQKRLDCQHEQVCDSMCIKRKQRRKITDQHHRLENMLKTAMRLFARIEYEPDDDKLESHCKVVDDYMDNLNLLLDKCDWAISH